MVKHVVRVVAYGASDEHGARFMVKDLHDPEALPVTVPYDYSASNAAQAAVAAAFRRMRGIDVPIEYGGEDSHFTYYVVTVPE